MRTGILIDDVVRVDLSPDSLAQVHAYPHLPLSSLEYLLFTHTHDDHFAVRELQYLSPNFAPLRTKPLRVWGTEFLLGRIRTTMGKFFEPAPLVMNTVEPFCGFPVAHLTVIGIPSNHKTDEPCLNYLVTEVATRKTLLYATDTGWYHEATWEFLAGKRLDAVILECGLGGNDTGYAGHLSLDGCVSFNNRLAADCDLAPDAPFYLTHISHTGLLSHEVLSERAAVHGIQVAYDGLEIVF